MSTLYRTINLTTCLGKLFWQPTQLFPLAVRNYAARKGTRERKNKKKVKVEVQKVGFIPHNQRNLDKLALMRKSRKFSDAHLGTPVDNVFIQKYFKWIVYPFSEAVKCHRETHHPEIYNRPNASVYATIELNMTAAKKTRVIDNFSRIVSIPHKFDHGEERTLLAFTKDDNERQSLQEAGASLVGGIELIKEIQNGIVSVNDYHHVIANPKILPELVSLRGLLKRKFPNPTNGTLNSNLMEALNTFLHGLNYSAVKDEHEKDFGIIETIIGTLNMDEKHLEENFAALIQDVYQMKPNRDGSYITRCYLWSPPSSEQLKVDYELYLPSINKSETISDENDDDKVEVVVAS